MRTVSVGGMLALAAMLAMSSAAVIWGQVGGPAAAPAGRTAIPRSAGPTLDAATGRAPGRPATSPRPSAAQLPAAESRNPFAPAPGTPDAGLVAEPAGIPQYSDLLGPRSASLTVDWVTPETIILGQEADFELVLRNRGRSAVEKVVVEQVLPDGFRLVGSNPAPQQQGEQPSWTLPRIEPQQEGRITLRLVPNKVGPAQSQARVHFSAASSAAFRVVEPKLRIEAEAPQEAIVGNQAILNVTVRNPGTGRATNVMLSVELPKELVASGQTLRYELGTLNPGEAQSVRILAQVTDLGRHQCKFIATADFGLRDEAMKEFTAVGARLEIAIDGPKLRYVTRPADYEVRVRNTGTSSAHNVHVQVRVPKAFAYLDGGRHGRFDSQTK
ncbi:MAG TPA: CARDB domain-containing protein, partial [Planctomycetaceae bacterium]|nr:CARDB domain-containing protein [Planctomycetaceae bacterium]